MSRVVSVGLVEPQPLLRELVSKALLEIPDVSLLWSAPGAKEARELFATQPTDVLVSEMDLSDGNGVGLAVSLKKSRSELGIVLLSDSFSEDELIGIPAGAMNGWRVLPRADMHSLQKFVVEIQAAAAGQTRIPSQRSITTAEDAALADLTPRQLQVVAALADGLDNPTIAQRLGIEVSSVVNHLTAIYAALDVPSWANPRVYSTLVYFGQRPHESVAD